MWTSCVEIFNLKNEKFSQFMSKFWMWMSFINFQFPCILFLSHFFLSFSVLTQSYDSWSCRCILVDEKDRVVGHDTKYNCKLVLFFILLSLSLRPLSLYHIHLLNLDIYVYLDGSNSLANNRFPVLPSWFCVIVCNHGFICFRNSAMFSSLCGKYGLPSKH